MFVNCFKQAAAILRGTSSDDTGSLTIFSLFLFLIIVATGGLAVDVMYHEVQRQKMQNTLDSAVLAAASATQSAASREEVVREYIQKAGLDAGDVKIDSTGFGGVSTATATGRTRTTTAFATLLGVDFFDSQSVTLAQERVTSVEISLVVDLTSSMKSSGRLDALINSVDDFVNVVFQIECDDSGCTEPDPDVNTTINVVPYGGTVNPGKYMAEKLGLQRWHAYSNCGVVPEAAYFDTELPYGATMQVPHFYVWHKANAAASQAFGWCPPGEDNVILYAANHPQQIKDYMRTLRLNDGTGTDIGVKWGMSLLDPSSRDEFNDLIARGDVAGNTSGTFPEDHAENVLKIVVVMTDGGITFQSAPHQKMADGSWVDFQFEQFYDDDGVRRAFDDTEFYDERVAANQRFGSCVPYDECNGETPPDNRDIAEVELTISRNERTDTINNQYVTRDEAIKQMEFQCALARRAKPDLDTYVPQVTVYTVRLIETSAWTEDYLKPCATQESFYFDVDSVFGLEGAFSSIAGHINNQRLSLTN